MVGYIVCLVAMGAGCGVVCALVAMSDSIFAIEAMSASVVAAVLEHVRECVSGTTRAGVVLVEPEV